MDAILASMWIPSGYQLRMCAPELALVATMVVVLIAPLIIRRHSYATALIVMLGALGTSVLAAGLVAEVSESGLAALAPSDAAPMLLIDRLSLFFKGNDRPEGAALQTNLVIGTTIGTQAGKMRRTLFVGFDTRAHVAHTALFTFVIVKAQFSYFLVIFYLTDTGTFED